MQLIKWFSQSSGTRFSTLRRKGWLRTLGGGGEGGGLIVFQFIYGNKQLVATGLLALFLSVTAAVTSVLWLSEVSTPGALVISSYLGYWLQLPSN